MFTWSLLNDKKQSVKRGGGLFGGWMNNMDSLTSVIPMLVFAVYG